MIHRLTIEGFQSLAHINIELGKFTVVVGASNSGKSAIRRAIEAVVRNDPATGRLRTGAKAIGVGMDVDGIFVGWAKTAKTTSYMLGEMEIAKPGATCPPAVIDLLRLGDINFASQFDRPYLLAETPSTAAKAMGELTNIAVLFAGIREATRRQRAAGLRANTLADEHAKLIERLDSFADLPAEKTSLDAGYAALSRAQEAEQAGVAAEVALHNAVSLQARASAAAAALDALPPLDDAVELLERVDALLDDARRGAEVGRRLQVLHETLVKTQEHVGYLARIDAVNVDEIEAQALVFDRQQTGLLQAQVAERAIADAIEKLAAATQAEADVAAELAEIDTCPLCGGSLMIVGASA